MPDACIRFSVVAYSHTVYRQMRQSCQMHVTGPIKMTRDTNAIHCGLVYLHSGFVSNFASPRLQTPTPILQTGT